MSKKSVWAITRLKCLTLFQPELFWPIRRISGQFSWRELVWMEGSTAGSFRRPMFKPRVLGTRLVVVVLLVSSWRPYDWKLKVRNYFPCDWLFPVKWLGLWIWWCCPVVWAFVARPPKSNLPPWSCWKIWKTNGSSSDVLLARGIVITVSCSFVFWMSFLRMDGHEGWISVHTLFIERSIWLDILGWSSGWRSLLCASAIVYALSIHCWSWNNNSHAHGKWNPCSIFMSSLWNRCTPCSLQIIMATKLIL